MNGRSSSETGVPSLRERIRQATANAILAAAEQVFAERGFETAHMGDIAAGAGVAVGTLYNHFEDRDAMLRGLFAARAQELIDRLDAALESAHGRPFREHLAASVRAFCEFFEAHQPFHRLMLVHEAKVQQSFVTDELKQQIRARTDKLFKRGVREGAIRAELLDCYHALLMGMIKGLWLRTLNDGLPLPPAGEIARFFVEGARV